MAHPDISSDTPGKAPGASAPGPKLHHPRGLTLAEMVAYFSTHMTLLPGDLLATGTPPGVGFGKNRYMAPGDVLECGITNLGSQRHEIRA